MTRHDLTWPAPAKLNLMLHITGQRPDGYHELQTVFQFIDLQDELRFAVRPDGIINRLDDVSGIPAHDDLTVKSAKTLQQHANTSLGVDIHLSKRIPVGAGLGGGSSDAATTLHALNRLWQLDYSTEQLADIGLTLGADVPVFVHGFAAFAEGVGECLEPVMIEQPWYLVITPDVHVSTAEIFSDTELTRNSPALKICDLSTAGWDNVCVPVVVRRYPEVGKALKLLGNYAKARMSGTGASVFAQVASEQEAERILLQLQASPEWGSNWQAFICQGMNTSPLIEFLQTI